MKKRNLNEVEVEKLNDLINLTKSLDNLYKENEKLEKDGKKNTEGYKKNLKYINLIIEEEYELYNKLRDDSNIIVNIFNYLSTKVNCLLIENYSTILEVGNLHRIYFRILYKLRDLVKPLTFTEDNIAEALSDYNNNSIKEDYDTTLLYDCNMMNKTITDDILHMYLYNIYSCNINENDKITEKYNISFVSNDVENYMMENNFEINKNPEFIADYVASILSVDYDEYLDFSNMLVRENAIFVIENILNIFEENNINVLNSNDLILNVSLLGALLNKLDMNNYGFVIDYYEEMLEDEKLHGSIFERVINVTIIKAKKDKEKIKILKPRN